MAGVQLRKRVKANVLVMIVIITFLQFFFIDHFLIGGVRHSRWPSRHQVSVLSVKKWLESC
jgi:hypothetical protein